MKILKERVKGMKEAEKSKGSKVKKPEEKKEKEKSKSKDTKADKKAEPSKDKAKDDKKGKSKGKKWKNELHSPSISYLHRSYLLICMALPSEHSSRLNFYFWVESWCNGDLFHIHIARLFVLSH